MDKYRILNPEYLEIPPMTLYYNKETAIKEYRKWAKGFEQQNFYSSVSHGKIYLTVLARYCKLVNVTTQEIETMEVTIQQHQKRK